VAIESPLAVSLQDIANIVTFIAPGYFAITIYAIKYAKSERSISRLVIESMVWSLFFVAINNYIWEKLLNHSPATSLNKEYILILLTVAVIAGFVAAELRLRWPIKQIASRLGVDSPHEDFVKTHFIGLQSGDFVSVKLKSGTAFSGRPTSGSIYTKDGPRKYCFEDIAWYDDDKHSWEETDNTIMVDLREIEYIVSPRKKKAIQRKRSLNKKRLPYKRKNPKKN
jgi:hypothetical protein